MERAEIGTVRDEQRVAGKERNRSVGKRVLRGKEGTTMKVRGNNEPAKR